MPQTLIRLDADTKHEKLLEALQERGHKLVENNTIQAEYTDNDIVVIGEITPYNYKLLKDIINT